MKGVFKCACRKLWKKSKKGQELNLGDAQGTPRHVPRSRKHLSLGMPKASPFFVNNHQVFLVSLYFYSFAHYVFFLERLFAFCFQFSFAFFAGHIDTFGPLFCFGERHAPLFHETLLFFTYIFLSVIASYVLLLALVFIYHHVQSY